MPNFIDTRAASVLSSAAEAAAPVAAVKPTAAEAAGVSKAAAPVTAVKPAAAKAAAKSSAAAEGPVVPAAVVVVMMVGRAMASGPSMGRTKGTTKAAGEENSGALEDGGAASAMPHRIVRTAAGIAAPSAPAQAGCRSDGND